MNADEYRRAFRTFKEVRLHVPAHSV